MIHNVSFIQKNEGEMPPSPPPTIPVGQDGNVNAFTFAKESLEKTIHELTKERDQLRGHLICVEALLEERDSGQVEAITAIVQMAMTQLWVKFQEEINAKGTEIAELRRELVPLKAEREARLEAERIAQEKYWQERKDAAIQSLIHGAGIGPTQPTEQIGHIQSMNPKEIEVFHQELARLRGSSLGPRAQREVIRRMAAGNWIKERMLQPWV